MGSKHLTENERCYIQKFLSEKKTPYEIAKLLGRSPSCIYREIKRGSEIYFDTHLREVIRYYADTGQRVHDENNSNKGRPPAIGSNIRLSDRLEELIVKERFSPYAALEISRKEGFEINICLTTLYSYIHKGGVFLSLAPKHLRYRKKRYKKRDKPGKALHNLKGKSIEQRLPSVDQRSSYGHWEMDTVYSGKNKHTVLFVLSERLTREQLIFKQPHKSIDCCAAVLDNLERVYKNRFREKFKSITCDNGVEFINPERLEKSVFNDCVRRTDIYYCHPYSSFERGTNENQNKIIRRFIPKGSDIAAYTDDEIKAIEKYMNTMPRKLFCGKSALDMVHEYGFV